MIEFKKGRERSLRDRGQRGGRCVYFQKLEEIKEDEGLGRKPTQARLVCTPDLGGPYGDRGQSVHTSKNQKQRHL
jgi:hypothetical protein